MNKEKILAMEAGKKLDTLIAKEFYGADTITKASRLSDKTFYALVSGEKEGFQPLEKGKSLKNVWWRHTIAEAWEACPAYSNDITASWNVVENIKARGLKILLNIANEKSDGVMRGEASKGDWHCNILGGDNKGNHIYCKTAPEAICKAALLAVMES